MKKIVLFLVWLILIGVITQTVLSACTSADDGSEQKTLTSGQTEEIKGLNITLNSVYYESAIKLSKVINSTGLSNDRVRFYRHVDGLVYEASLISEGVGDLVMEYVYSIKYYDSPLVEDDEFVFIQKVSDPSKNDTVYEGEYISFFYDLATVNYTSSAVSGVFNWVPQNAANRNPGVIITGECGEVNDIFYCPEIVNATFTSATIKVATHCNACQESWLCDDVWSECINGQQTRTCTDSNNCGTTISKPSTVQSCGCIESWSCTNWSTCTNSQQTKTCTDSNKCGTTANKPAVSQNCTVGACTEDWDCSNWGSCTNSKKTRICSDSNKCGTTVNKPSSSRDCTTAQTATQAQEQENKSEELKISNEGTFMLNGKNVSVKRDEDGEISIDFGGGEIVDVKGAIEMVKDELGAYILTSMGKQKVEISAKDAIMKANKIDEVKKVEIEEYKTIAVYSVYGTKNTRLFFVIPASADVVQRVSIEKGVLMSTELPWWRFLAFGI